MNETFKKRYHQLGVVTAVILACELVFLVLALVNLLLGFPKTVPSFLGLAGGLSVASTGLLGLFLITSLAAAVVLLRDLRRKRIA